MKEKFDSFTDDNLKMKETETERLRAIKTDVHHVKSEVPSLRDHVNKIESDLNDKVDELNSNVNKIESKLNKKVDELNNNMNKIERELNEKVDTLNNNVSEILRILSSRESDIPDGGFIDTTVELRPSDRNPPDPEECPYCKVNHPYCRKACFV